MPANEESLKSAKKAKKELDISKLAKVKNKKIARTFRRKAILQPETKLDIKWRRLAKYAGIIAVATLLLYGTSLFGQMTFNDFVNLQIKSTAPQPDSVWLQLMAMAQQTPFNQPWVQATYLWDTQSFPGIPAWYHFVNIMLHLMSCIYLFLFSFQFFFWLKEEKRIKFDPYQAALAPALIFMCHPFATGAVAYISGRAGLLSCLNLFLALNLFMLGFYSLNTIPIISFYFGAMICLAISIFCAPQGAFFPLLIIVLAVLLKPGKESWNSWFRERWQDFAIFGLAAAAALATLLMKAPTLLDNGVDLALPSRIDYTLLQAGSLATYFLRYVLIPVGITLDNPEPGSMEMPLAALGVGVMTALAAGTWWLRKNPPAFLGGLITLAAIIANFIFVQHEIVSDSRYYVALAGLALVAGTLLAEYVPFTKANLRLLGLVFAVLCGLTIWRQTAYFTDTSLWTSACQYAKSTRSMGYLSRALYNQHQDEARVKANATLALDPKCPPANEALGLILVSERKFKEAVPFLKQAVQRAKELDTVPEKLSTYQSELADAAMRAEDWKTCKEAAAEALKTRPGQATLHLAMGQVLLKENNPSRAFEELNLGTSLDRLNPEFLEPTAEACLALGSPQYVAYGFSKAKLASKITRSLKAAFLYSLMALDLGKLGEAKESLETLLKYRGPHPEAMYMLAYTKRLMHDEAGAKELLQAALKLDPKVASKVHIRPVDLTEMRKELSKPRYVEPPAEENKTPSQSAQPGQSGESKPTNPASQPFAGQSGQPAKPSQPGQGEGTAKERRPSYVAPETGISGGLAPEPNNTATTESQPKH